MKLFIFGCWVNLISVDLSNFDISGVSVSDLSSMFYKYKKLLNVNLKSFIGKN